MPSGSLIVGELRARRIQPCAPAAPYGRRGDSCRPFPPAPSRFPSCRFSDGKEIRVGDTARRWRPRLGRAAESGRQEVDRGSLGERLTRFYEYAGFRFILVFEPFERNGEPRVAAIYLP